MRAAMASALAALTGVAGAVLSLAAAPDDGARATAAAQLVVITAYVGVGLLVLAGRRGHAVGRIALLGAAGWGLGEGLLDPAVRRLADHPDDRLAALAGTIGSATRGLGWLALVLLLPLHFPDGRRAGSPVVRRWSWRAAVAACAAFTAAALLVPTSEDERLAHVDNPIGLPISVAWVADLLSLVGTLWAVVALALIVVSAVQRWRRDDSLVRQQLLWFALAFACPVVLFPLAVASHASSWMFSAATLPVPVAIGVAVRQHRLYDVQLVLNRSLAYGALSVVIAGLYAVVVGGVGAMLQVRGAAWLPWVGAGVVAVSFAPLHAALQRAANRLTYGQWAQPAEVLARTGRRLADAGDVTALLRGLTDELARSLRLDLVEIIDASGYVLAATGSDRTAADSMPLTAYGQQVGVLRWRAHRRLRPADEALLGDVAAQLGGVVHSAGLLEALRTSHVRLVLASEDERRRLRRELHDGLGPALAAVMMRLDAARNRCVDRGSELDEALLGVRAAVSDTVVDVRRIVEGLRPSALDERGLDAALRELAERVTADSGVRVAVEVAALPEVSAAVEVAAYRIAQEALTNVVRHAQASHAGLRLALADGHVRLEIRDNGTGMVAPRRGGVGLGSMHERARELGGSLTVGAASGGGTAVLACLPLAPMAAT